MSGKTRDRHGRAPRARPGAGKPTARSTSAGRRAGKRPQRRRGFPIGARVVVAVGLTGVVLFGIFWFANRDAGTTGGGQGAYPYAVGDPGPGATAPPIRLAGSDGRTFDLAAQRGKTTLLYFQEGLMCQPCWDQLTDIERDWRSYQALGIDQVVSVTTDPLDAIKQKLADMGLRTSTLSDPDLKVSLAYSTNQYGMMGNSRNGHSFIVVGPDGRIRFRADYGGAPKYTMFVPSGNLLADLRKGLGAGGA